MRLLRGHHAGKLRGVHQDYLILPSRFSECRIRAKGRYFLVLESDA